MTNPTPTRRPQPSEEGYTLVVVIFMMALLALALSVAVPKVAKEIQRDHELETMQRGKQYMRAIKMYYKKFGAYPPNLEALTKPNGPAGLRFLRKKYTDPMTGKDDWKPVYFGQNKAPTAMGFFGVPLAGSSIAGIGPGAAGDPLGQQGATTDPNASPTSTGKDPNANGANANTSAIPGATGPTFGGVGIIGFSPGNPKKSILVYKKKDHYNEWEFVYDPLAEQRMMGSSTGPSGAVPAANMGGLNQTGVPTTGISPAPSPTPASPQ